MKKFEQELNALKHRVMEMGKATEEMVVRSTAAPDRPGYQRHGESAQPPRRCWDRFSTGKSTARRLRLITHLHRLIAKDLRFLLDGRADQRGTGAHRRSGGQQLRIRADVEGRSEVTMRDIARMSEITRGMVRGALDAFRQEDIDKAQAVLTSDDEVDQL
jgi:phosphate uptake regulator